MANNLRSKKPAMMWALLILSLVWVATSAPAPAPAPAASSSQVAPSPGPDCMTQIFNMTDCLSYVQEGANATKPDTNCCPELAGMLDSNPACLCTMLGKSTELPIALDLKRALKLPSLCGLQAPPVSMCSLLGIPVAAPSPGAAASAATPSSSLGMSVSPSPLGGDVEGPSGSKNGAPTLNSYTTLSFLISTLTFAALTLSSRD